MMSMRLHVFNKLCFEPEGSSNHQLWVMPSQKEKEKVLRSK